MGTTTADKILDISHEMLNKAGYTAFSYRDLSRELGIKTSSIHYHFPTKADLVTALARRYRTLFNAVLQGISKEADLPETKFKAFLKLFQESFKESGNICLCSMMSANLATLPESARLEARGVWSDAEEWLSRVLAEGKKSGVFSFEESPYSLATTIFASLEGGTVSANTFQDKKRLKLVTDWIRSSLNKKL